MRPRSLWLPAATGLARLQQADLLRANREAAAVALEQVGDADETGDELAGGALVDLDRRPELLDAAVVDHHQAVAHRQRLLLVVGDEDERDADLALDPLELELHLLAQLEVERAERLVEQQHVRLVDDRAGERDALALSAGELDRFAGAEARAGGPARVPPPRAPRRCARATRLTRSPYSTFSSTFMCGNSA